MDARPTAHTHALDVSRGNARASAEALALDARRAAAGLGLDTAALAAVLDTDAGAADAIRAGASRESPGTALAERMLLLVRLHRALGDVHGSLERMNAWLDAVDPTLGDRPRTLITTTDGLRRVVDHTESRCNDCLW